MLVILHLLGNETALLVKEDLEQSAPSPLLWGGLGLGKTDAKIRSL
jgi:hypothetical protein